MDCSHQAPPSMGFSRQEHWSGVPLPSPLIILVSLLYIIVVYAFPSPYLCSWHSPLSPPHGQKKVNSAGMACSNPTPSKEMTCLHLVHGHLLGDNLWAAETVFLRSVFVCLMPLTVLCCCSVTKSCLTLSDPVDCSRPGSSILHYLLEFAQIHVHWVSDVILPSLPPLAPFFCLQSFPAFESFPMSWLIASSIGASASASVLPMNIQGWFPLGSTGLISLLSKGLSRIFTIVTAWKHQFFRLSLLYGPSLTSIHYYWKNHSFDYMELCWQNDVSTFEYPL